HAGYLDLRSSPTRRSSDLGQDLILFTGSSRTGAGAGDPASVRRVRAADGCLFFGRHVPEEPVRRLLEDGFPLVYIGRRTGSSGTDRKSTRLNSSHVKSSYA